MLKDMSVVVWKELREILLPEGRFWGNSRNLFVMLGIGGLLFPLQSGPDWFKSWFSVSTACFPILMTINYTADAIAGERERHTLETLLASRLDGRAILLGKMLAIILYGWSLVLVCQPLAFVAVNAVHGREGWLYYRPAILLSIVGMSLIVAVLLTAVGVLVSLTAPTVRSAGQRLLVPFLVVFALPGLVAYLVQRMGWEHHVSRLTPGAVVMILGGLATAVAGTCVAAGLRRFTRERALLA